MPCPKARWRRGDLRVRSTTSGLSNCAGSRLADPNSSTAVEPFRMSTPPGVASWGMLRICWRRRGDRPAPALHDDLVCRRFVADRPNMLWVTDITQHPTRDGTVYCCAVLDVYSRMIVGWSIADHMRAELVVDALQMACWRRQPRPG